MTSLCLKFPKISVLKAVMQGKAGGESCTIKAKGSQYWHMYANYAKPHLTPFTPSVQIHAQIEHTSIDLYKREVNNQLTVNNNQSSYFLMSWLLL